MAEMFIEVRAAADPVIPEKYTMDVCYADEAFEALNPYFSQVITIDPPNGNALLNIFENVNDARTWYFDQHGQSAIDALNTFFGDSRYTLALRIKTDFDTWEQIQADVATLRGIMDSGLGGKSPVGHTHTINDVSDLESGVTDKVNALKGVPGGVASLDGSTKIPVSELPAIAYSSLSGKPTLFSGVYADLTSKPTLFSGAYTDLTGKPTIPTITAQTHVADAATNAATNAPTNLNVVTTLLGSLTGEVNATNTKQNDLATKYNDLASKFNTLLDRLEANSLLSP